jgi:hypothetical protein
VLEVTDRRRRTTSYDLTDAQGPYTFAYGTWDSEADLAVVDALGKAVLLVDRKMFRMSDVRRFQSAAGLDAAEVQEQPPKRPDALTIVSPPLFRWATMVFFVGLVGFGLWSLTGIDAFVLGLTLPAVVIATVLGVMARRSMLSPEAFKEETAKLEPIISEALATADAYLAEHGYPNDADIDESSKNEGRPMMTEPAAESDEQ